MLREDNATSPTAEKSVGEADLALDKTFNFFFLQLVLLFPCKDLIPCYVTCYVTVWMNSINRDLPVSWEYDLQNTSWFAVGY